MSEVLEAVLGDSRATNGKIEGKILVVTFFARSNCGNMKNYSKSNIYKLYARKDSAQSGKEVAALAALLGVFVP